MIAWYNVPIGLTMLFYALEFAMMSVLVSNVFQYSKWLNAKRRIKDTNAVRLIGYSIPLNLFMPFAVCVVYIGGYGYPDYKMWENGSFIPNTRFGLFCWVLKYVGFIMLTVGLVRITNMWKKSKARWNEIRSGRFRQKQEAKKQAKEAAASGKNDPAQAV